MITLNIDNSECWFDNLPSEHYDGLRVVLSYKISDQQSFFSGNYHQTIRYLLDKRHRFPTGLLYLVLEYLKNYKLQFVINDIRRIPEPLKSFPKLSLPYPPYPEQEAAADAAQHFKRGIITAPTGVGKSLMAALIIDKFRVKTLIVVPTLELKRQFQDTIKKLYGDSKDTITVENVDALDSHKVLDFDCLIMDEFHHSAAKTRRTLNKYAFKNIYYKIGLTATPWRSNVHEKMLLESVLSEVIYEIPYKTAVEKQYIVPIDAYYYEIPSTELENPYTWAAVYSELIVNNKKRNAIIADILKNLSLQNRSTLCLVKEIKHGEYLAKLTGIPFIFGDNENNKELLDKFNSKVIPCVIGTTGVMGEGVDTKSTEFVVIAGLGKSKTAFMQQVGRAFRKYFEKDRAKVIVFKDLSHKWTLSHFKAQVKILKEEYGVMPVKLIGT